MLCSFTSGLNIYILRAQKREEKLSSFVKCNINNFVSYQHKAELTIASCDRQVCSCISSVGLEEEVSFVLEYFFINSIAFNMSSLLA